MNNCQDNNESRPLFRDLTAEDPDPEVIEIESLCVQCGENGTTRLLLTKIPFYKEVVVISFSCDHCQWENNELQPASKVQEMGIKYKLKVLNIKDLSREVVKTEWATVCIPEIEFEIPARTQAGVITTIEGLLDRAINGLNQRLLSIKDEDPEIFSNVSSFVEQLKDLLEVKEPFIFEIDDPSGNSFLQNFSAPQKDENLSVSYYKRTSDQDKFLGIAIPEEPTSDIVGEEVFTFSTNCPNCNAPCETNMKMTQIPHFKETVIMATNCDSCGHRTNEVKGGGGIEPSGSLLKLQIQSREDLNRDVLKSETCGIRIPDLDFEVGSGALGGRFTTVEGLLQNIKAQLQEHNPMLGGDSMDPSFKTRMEDFLSQIDKILSSEKPVMLILDDPCGNSYIQSLSAPEPDPNLSVTKYERTFEQNEELGLNDMKTENYENV